MILQFLQTVHYILIIHSFGTDDPDGSVHSVSQFISGSYNAAVLHSLDRHLITDVNLDSCILSI